MRAESVCGHIFRPMLNLSRGPSRHDPRIYQECIYVELHVNLTDVTFNLDTSGP